MKNSVDPDQLASSDMPCLHKYCLQRQGIYEFSRTGVKISISKYMYLVIKKNVHFFFV